MADSNGNVDQERCMALAAPLLIDLHQAWYEAFGQYLKYPAEFTAEHDDTTAANCIRSHMWTEVVRRFDGRHGCKLLSLGRLNLLLYKNDVVWRFKKVDGSGRHQNYQTKQQRDYDDQLELPGLPGAAVRLTSGYQPDGAGQAIDRVIVSRPLGKSMMWAAQTNVIDNAASWVDITPRRLAGTDRFDYRARRS